VIVFPEANAKFDPGAVGIQGASVPDRTLLLARLPALAAEIAKDAVRRDRERELPFEAFRLFRESGLGALRVPARLGGPGGSIPDYIETIVTLAAADSNVAHALRSHFNFCESLILAPSSTKARTYLSKVLDGKLFGGAAAELGTARPGDIENTKLVRQGESYRLNGRKYYATGTAFADYASFGALDETGKLVSALVPADRAGVNILDDWDGMGQRLTASGGVDLVDVEVFPHEVGERGQSVMTGLIGRHTSALRQLHLIACVNGVVRNIFSDAVEYVRKHARTTRHADAEKAVDDAFVQQVTGRLAATVFAVDAIIAEAARIMGRAADALAAEAPDAEDLVLKSALATARAQLVAGRLGLNAAEEMFEIGGGSTTSRKYNFDRHWRNIRTILNHNPLNHKARVLGDYFLNGTETHLREGRVF
jgi:alkylation response protein AidB-like acyl-CoA dehydrogenase